MGRRLYVAEFWLVECFCLKVNAGSKSEKACLQPGDIIMEINGLNTGEMLNVEAQNKIKSCTTQLQLLVERWGCLYFLYLHCLPFRDGCKCVSTCLKCQWWSWNTRIETFHTNWKQLCGHICNISRQPFLQNHFLWGTIYWNTTIPKTTSRTHIWITYFKPTITSDMNFPVNIASYTQTQFKKYVFQVGKANAYVQYWVQVLRH